MTKQLDSQKRAVDSGHWILYRFDPRRAGQGLNPLQIDSKAPSIPMTDYIYCENRYRFLKKIDSERAARLAKLAQYDSDRRWHLYKQLSEIDYSWVNDKD